MLALERRLFKPAVLLGGVTCFQSKTLHGASVSSALKPSEDVRSRILWLISEIEIASGPRLDLFIAPVLPI